MIWTKNGSFPNDDDDDGDGDDDDDDDDDCDAVISIQSSSY
jgi:hypothetical protein